MSLRTKLIVVFLAATLAPMAVLLWVTLHLFEVRLSQATTVELDEVSLSLRMTGRDWFFRCSCRCRRISFERYHGGRWSVLS